MDDLTIVPFSFVGRGSFCKDFAGIVVDSNPSQLQGSANHLEQISGRLDAVFEITKFESAKISNFSETNRRQ